MKNEELAPTAQSKRTGRNGPGMSGKPFDIVERSFEYSCLIIRLYRLLDKDQVGRTLGKQLLKAGTSVGANLHEAQGGQSKADFISKISIAYKEALEADFWLKIVQKEKLVSDHEITALLDETSQLIKILSTILLNSKKNTNY